MVVDTSARAHAVADAYMRSPNVRRVIVPGNNFISYKPFMEVILEKANIKDPRDILRIAQLRKPDLVDVCQDDALAAGVVDTLQRAGFSAFGPTQAASRIEWDKAWARNFMAKHGIPHPAFQVFNESAPAEAYFRHIYADYPNILYFVKAQGLCAGKGAIGVSNLEEALLALKEMGKFGEAGRNFLIEEGIVGEEASVYAFSDGNHIRMMKAAQDHKRRDNFDAGPNTGGMGAVAPALVITDELQEEIRHSIMRRAIEGLAAEEIPYKGILYGGIMVQQGSYPGPKVVEFNARWGAPEAEVVVPGIKRPMDDIVQACLTGTLHTLAIDQDNLTRVCVVGASRGYPGDVSAVKGKQIYGLDRAQCVPGVKIFGAGIQVEEGKFYANGGRLFSLVAEGRNVREAHERALEGMARIYIEDNNLQYRTDIGHQDLGRYHKG